MSNRVDRIREVRSLFQERSSGAVPTSTLQLWFSAIDLRTARALNRLWHSRLPRFGRPTCRIAYAAECNGLYYAVAIWTNPNARMLPQLEWMELNRMADAPDAPNNSASRMLGWMVRDIRRRYPEMRRLVSYQELDYHAGTIYRAAGWRETQRSEGGDWNTASKPRGKAERDGPKQCWDKCLVCSMGPNRETMCEVCRERIPNNADAEDGPATAGDGGVEPAGADAA